MSRLLTALTAAAIALTTTEGAAEMTPDEIRQGYRNHAAMAQYHRWYQVYERPEGGIANALDILTPDVTVTSGLGTANGHEEYAARVTQLPATWNNAHHVGSTEIVHSEDGAMTLTAQIVYQNLGMLPDGAARQADLTYAVELVPGEGVLPLLSSVVITQNGEPVSGEFRDAYAENRVLSLVHYWLALIEDPARDPEPVREILVDAFSLNFSSGAITDFNGFADWLAGPGSQIAASTHVISNFSVEETGDNTYAMTVDFDWSGILPDDSVMVARTRHSWAVVNDPTERFARIKAVDVEVLEPFRPRGE
ncbi:hypothetical protein [Jannaschia pohangensis]|uniref:SnoaL-like domain-containing protein n=1 Tax=Jannaschia pohangensis TaxID=390807 RepID=A0A1I3V3C3_9RHOB|nr:hypothetical protein [Jannaschia pohangensis]SFJ89443.1 hypothetical protein SAMN04488095_0071 [Jannaschia pohangensis]